MEQLKKISTFLVGFATVVGLGITVYFQFIQKENVEIEIKVIDKLLLTETNNKEGLTIKYLYQDSVEVRNVWKIRYVISNAGTKTIIAKGNNNNVLQEYLPVIFKDSVKILSVKIESNFPVTSLQQNDIVLLDFKQWKKTEYLDIVALIENGSQTSPSISIDERDIVDAKIKYSVYKPNEVNGNKKLIDNFSKSFANMLKWVVVFYFFIILTGGIITIIERTRKNSKAFIANIIFFIFFLFAFLILSIPLLWVF